MAGFKNGKIMLPIKEFLIVKGQATYELNTIDMTKVTVFYRKYNQEAFLETYSEMPKGDYRINEVGGNKQLEITNLDILDEYYSIQLARVVDLTSSPYNPSGQIDVITLNQHLNEVIADVTFLFTYLKDVGMVMDSSNGNKIMAELKPYTTWYMDKDGNMAAMPVDSLFEKFNDLVQELRQEVLKLLEQDLEVAERELLEEVKRKLDEYVETDLKQRLDDYTTQLEERLQTMIDQAVADKGLMPEGSDWLEIGLGNWLVTDLFNKNYIHYPPQLNSSDNAGVVKKDITDGSKSQVIRFYTTTGKMLFIVRVNEVWSEWQELGGQTDTMQFTQANHGFIFTAVTLDGATRKWVKANKYTSADGIAIKIDNDRFDVVTRGVVNIPTQARDDKGEPFVYDEYYFLSQEVDGGLSRTKNEIGTFQYLAHISEIDGKQVAYIDIGDSYDLDYEVVDTETADRVGIGTYKTTLRTADTIEDLKRLNLKVGDIVEVLGYYTKGDGADHKRKIESSDDGSGVQLANGLWANIVRTSSVKVEWLGCRHSDDNFDNAPLLMKTIINSDISVFEFDDKTYTMSELQIINYSDLDYKTVHLKTNNTYFQNYNLEQDYVIGVGGKLGDITYTGVEANSVFKIDDCTFVAKVGSEIKYGMLTIMHASRSNISGGGQIWFRNCDEICGLYIHSLYESIVGSMMSSRNIHNTVPLYIIADRLTPSNSDPNTTPSSISSTIFERFHIEPLDSNGVMFQIGNQIFYDCVINQIDIEDSQYAKNGQLTTQEYIDSVEEFLPIIKGVDLTTLTINALCVDVLGYKNRGDKKLRCAIECSKPPKISNISGCLEYSVVLNLVPIISKIPILETNSFIPYPKNNLKGIFPNIQSFDSLIFFEAIRNGSFSNSSRTDYFKITYDGGIGVSVAKNNEYEYLYDNDFFWFYLTLIPRINSSYENIRVYVDGFLEFKKVAFLVFSDRTVFSKIVELKTSGTENYFEIDLTTIPSEQKNGNSLRIQFFPKDINSKVTIKGIAFNVVSQANQLNTSYYTTKMTQEGGTTLTDFYTYLDEKYAYDKQLEAEQKAKYESYQQALTNNPNLTYEEFIASYPMMLPNIEEPTIPQSVQEFMKKYL